MSPFAFVLAAFTLKGGVIVPSNEVEKGCPCSKETQPLLYLKFRTWLVGDRTHVCFLSGSREWGQASCCHLGGRCVLTRRD